MAKKPAITGIGRPQGFIDDTAKAIGKAIKKGVRKTENKVYRKAEDVLLNRQARKQVTRKMAPFKDDRAFYRAERKQEIRMEGGPFSYKAPKKKPPQPPKRSAIGKPPSVGSKGTGTPSVRGGMTTKELDAYRKMQGFDKTVNDIKKPKKRIR